MTNNDPKTYFLGDTCFSAMFKGNLRPKHRGLLQTFLAMHNYVGHAVIVPTIKARDRPLQVRQGIENQSASAFLLRCCSAHGRNTAFVQHLTNLRPIKALLQTVPHVHPFVWEQ